MVKTMMRSAKLATLGLLKIKLFWKVFWRGACWFKFNNLGLELGKDWTFYISVAKGLKLKTKTFSGMVTTFVKVTGEKAEKAEELSS